MEKEQFADVDLISGYDPKKEPSAFVRRRKNKNNVVFYTHFEEVLQKINPFGAYQIFAFIVILYASIEWAGNTTFMQVLGSLEPDWNCTRPDGTPDIITAPLDDEKCQIVKQECVQLTAVKGSVEFYSVVGAFKLVCDNKDKVKWIQIIQAGGSLVGSVFGGHMGDWFGRKTIFFYAQLLIIVTSIMSTAAHEWIVFSILQALNCFLYGVIETTSLTMMMEYTNNKYRVILATAFQWPLAYMVMSLIALLTKDWQNYFVFLNLVSCPLTIASMLFLESPRWLIANGNLNKACDVLNDIAHPRWNNTKARFTTNTISTIYKKQDKRVYYNFYHLFSSVRLAKQSVMQMLSMFTYSMVSNTYLYTVSGMHDSPIMFVFLDGVFRLFTPFLIIILDITLPQFGRKVQFVGSLVTQFALFGAVIVLVLTGFKYDDIAVTILVIVTTMINDCVFLINIVQITTQRYPTVIRCCAFGCLHSVKHIGSIIGLLVLGPLLTSSWPAGAFVVPEAMIAITLILGFFLQPETKGKALMDQMVEANYGRLENELPRALIRLAAGHKLAQMEIREQLKKEMLEAEAATKAGKAVASPWAFKVSQNNSENN
ncbi:unnamed protein product [Auanema sp. JU1783]|nr:unnamed protein product [Auanema sp. JU1783]